MVAPVATCTAPEKLLTGLSYSFPLPYHIIPAIHAVGATCNKTNTNTKLTHPNTDNPFFVNFEM